MKFKAFAIAVFLILTVLVTGQGTAHALSINDVRVGVHPEKTRLVLDLSQVNDFRAFVLDNPYRIVVDLPRFEWRAAVTGAISQGPIRDVRHGNLQQDISRVVFDVDRPVSLQKAFVLPASSGKPNRLVIDFVAVDAATFKQQRSNILGTLEVSPDNAGSYARSAQASAPVVPASAAAAVPAKKPPSREKPLVIIDPGHGGIDPGAIGANGAHEKTVALALARELREQLLNTGLYRVKMTRNSDKFIKLHDRVKFARNHNADLFISIHADSLSRPNVRGASVYTLSETASDEQTARLAARENRADLIAGIDLSHEDEDVANILVDLAMRDTTNQSRFFANTLVDNFKYKGVKLLERPHRYAGFAVLKAPDIPSVLVEAGFMSNRREADLLNTPAHRRKIAEALTSGVKAYFKTVEENERS